MFQLEPPADKSQGNGLSSHRVIRRGEGYLPLALAEQGKPSEPASCRAT